MSCHVFRLNELLWQWVALGLNLTHELLENTDARGFMSCPHVMSLCSPIIVGCYCRKIAIFEVLFKTSFIMPVLICVIID